MDPTKGPKKQFKCIFDKCPWSFDTRYKLGRHFKTHTGEKAFTCDICLKTFANSYGLKAHKKLHITAACSYDTCKEVFPDKKQLTNHTQEKHISQSWKCPLKRCKKIFSGEADLQEHLENHDLQYKCSHDGCAKRFSKPSVLKQHQAMHTQIRPFKCSYGECEKGFVTMQKLKRHQLIHDDKKEYSCNFHACGKSFNCQEYLTAHMRTHQETKPIKCPKENCCKHFACTSTLKVHLQKHANIRPHKCSFQNCSKTYLTASNLRAHENLHIQKPSANTIEQKTLMTVGDDFVDMNELINLPALDISIMSKEELVAAAFGEFACNQYMNCEDTFVGSYSNDYLNNKPDSSVNVFHELDKESLTGIQEEFVRNIYASSVNTDHSFLPSVEVPSDNSSKYCQNKSLNSMTDIGDQVEKICNSETVMLEPSMELSTGHMEIDGGCFEASSCMPDHIYSNKIYENSSTVNLQDIH